jgi:hypothetical protein
MYSISICENYLLVTFKADFDDNCVRVVIHHETQMPEYVRMNDIWLIDNHRALISMDEVDSLATEFRCMCPRNATRKKTAIVVNPGLTEAFAKIWVGKSEKRVPFELKIFHTLKEAEEWLGPITEAA